MAENEESAQSSTMTENDVLVCTVGGSPEPLISTINHHNPRRIIFIGSSDTEKHAHDIMSQTQHRVPYHFFELTDFQNLNLCVRDIRNELQNYLHKHKTNPEIKFVADITGGTKPMSAALTLAMMDYPDCRLSYIGGDKREGGTGKVQSGHEKIICLANPWEVMAIREIRDLVHAFNNSQFGNALDLAKSLQAKKLTDENFYDAMAFIVDSFFSWDTFAYAEAAKKMNTGIRKLTPYNNYRFPGIQNRLADFNAAFTTLNKILADTEVLQKAERPIPSGTGSLYLLDLLANASRRASLGRYDDAVARIYSAVEKGAKIALAKHGVDNSNISNITLESLPEDIKTRFMSERNNEGEIALGLIDSFTLLTVLYPDDPVSIRYMEEKDELKNSLSARNVSLLAHGYQPIKKEAYDTLLNVTLRFFQLEKDSLIHFPRLEMADFPIC